VRGGITSASRKGVDGFSCFVVYRGLGVSRALDYLYSHIFLRYRPELILLILLLFLVRGVLIFWRFFTVFL